MAAVANGMRGTPPQPASNNADAIASSAKTGAVERG
jgi:hypothetical protein